MWRSLVRAPAERSAPKEESFAGGDVAALPSEKRADAVLQLVRGEVARVLSLGRAAAVPAGRPLRELGLDSLMAVELRNALGRRVGATLPANLAFDYPTPAAIAAHLLATVPSLAGGTPPSPPTARPANGVAAKAMTSTVSNALAPAPEPPPTFVPAKIDHIDTIPMGERWLADGFRVIPTPASFAQRTVDMTRATAALAALAEDGLRGTFTHLLVRAAALALARNPKLHETVVGYRRITPGSADIGLSMLGQTTYAPVVVLHGADRVPLRELVGMVASATAAARTREEHDLQTLRRFGWMTPFGFFRRFVIRMLQKTFWFRHRLVGTFQVTIVPTADSGVPLQFYSGSILSSGRVHDAPVAVQGRIEVRPVLTLSVCAEHAAGHGGRAAALLREIAQILEGDELFEEARVSPEVSAPALIGPAIKARQLDTTYPRATAKPKSA